MASAYVHLVKHMTATTCAYVALCHCPCMYGITALHTYVYTYVRAVMAELLYIGISFVYVCEDLNYIFEYQQCNIPVVKHLISD